MDSPTGRGVQHFINKIESRRTTPGASTVTSAPPIRARFLHGPQQQVNAQPTVPRAPPNGVDLAASSSNLRSEDVPPAVDAEALGNASKKPTIGSSVAKDDRRSGDDASSSESEPEAEPLESSEVTLVKDRHTKTPSERAASALRSAFAGVSSTHARSSYIRLEDAQDASSTIVASSADLPLSGGSRDSTYKPDASVPDVRPSRFPHHHQPTDLSPVESRTLFSRKASPLYLPELDAYLETLPAPDFQDATQNERGKSPLPDRPAAIRKSRMIRPKDMPQKFPPLELIEKTTIADLKNNGAVPPMWRDRNTIFEMVTSWVLGATGASMLASFYSLQGIYDSVQVFALMLTSVVKLTDESTRSAWRELFLGKVPNILALNVSVLTESVLFFVVFQMLAIALVGYFHRATDRFVNKQPMHEGLLEVPEAAKASGWGVLLAAFLLMVVYLPISVISVHGLVWSSDFWPVPNPYTNSTTFPPQVPPLGPSDEWRDPLDFCWTTTMKKDSLNWAPFVIMLSLISFAVMTVYFPIRLWLTTRTCLPEVDPFSELGRKRSEVEMDHEYQRLLDRDPNPLSFLYSEFRRSWGTYKSIYIVIKLSALLPYAIVDPNNCLFRNSSREEIDVTRQAILLGETIIALLAQSWLAPFIDPVSNASEWTSRAGYVATSLVGLLVALNVKGSAIFNGPVLYVIYALNYGLNIYFSAVNISWARTLVKRIAKRLDFSVDIFSPRLDTSPTSVHVQRRIYQESVSALLLASPECRMPPTQKVIYNDTSAPGCPPFLMKFTGSPAERHAENLKILSDVGGDAYSTGVALRYGIPRQRFKTLEKQIEKHHVGPDAFWRPPGKAVKGCSHYFGNAWWIPFPPTLAFRYDRQGDLVLLTTLEELESFVAQNTDEAITEKRKLRIAFRALDLQVVSWPYTHVELVGASAWKPFGRRFKIQSTTSYETCSFTIKRHGVASWTEGTEVVQLGSGFDLELRYARNLTVGGTIIGLDDDFSLTPQVARFLLMNHAIIEQRTPVILDALDEYRHTLRKTARWKRDVLSYRFLTSVYNHACSPETVTHEVETTEKDLRVRDLVLTRQDALSAAYERVQVVSKSRVATWWFILWDDLWRQNNQAITTMHTHEPDFNPQFPTSIAYRPLPRSALEAFLSQRGLLVTKGASGFIHVGFLNKVYTRMSQIAFSARSSKVLRAHIGDRSTELDVSELRFGTHTTGASLGTGAGTDHDDVEIRVRPTYRWESVYDDRQRSETSRWFSRVENRMAVWFGFTPFRKTITRTGGIGFDVKLVDGHYIAVHDEDD